VSVQTETSVRLIAVDLATALCRHFHLVTPWAGFSDHRTP
jgi:hypothetical protein